MRLLHGLVVGIFSTFVIGSTLCACAGAWDDRHFWTYAAVYGLLAALGTAIIDPQLRKERLKPGPGGRDRLLIPVAKVLYFAHLLLAGLDIGRHHWSDTLREPSRILALILFTTSAAFAVYAMAVNRYFSPVVRIQKERGHQIVTSDVYRVVRHPGYAGIIVAVLCSPVTLGSWISGIPVLILAVFIIRRTVIEDRFLQAHLQGYLAYTFRVRYRLFPGVW